MFKKKLGCSRIFFVLSVFETDSTDPVVSNQFSAVLSDKNLSLNTCSIDKSEIYEFLSSDYFPNIWKNVICDTDT